MIFLVIYMSKHKQGKFSPIFLVILAILQTEHFLYFSGNICFRILPFILVYFLATFFFLPFNLVYFSGNIYFHTFAIYPGLFFWQHLFSYFCHLSWSIFLATFILVYFLYTFIFVILPSGLVYFPV